VKYTKAKPVKYTKAKPVKYTVKYTEPVKYTKAKPAKYTKPKQPKQPKQTAKDVGMLLSFMKEMRAEMKEMSHKIDGTHAVARAAATDAATAKQGVMETKVELAALEEEVTEIKEVSWDTNVLFAQEVIYGANVSLTGRDGLRADALYLIEVGDVDIKGANRGGDGLGTISFSYADGRVDEFSFSGNFGLEGLQRPSGSRDALYDLTNRWGSDLERDRFRAHNNLQIATKVHGLVSVTIAHVGSEWRGLRRVSVSRVDGAVKR